MSGPSARRSSLIKIKLVGDSRGGFIADGNCEISGFEAEQGLRLHVSLGRASVQRQKKKIEVESLHTFRSLALALDAEPDGQLAK